MVVKINKKQAQNIARELRLARATTEEESEKHFNNVDRLVEKYGIIIPNEVQRQRFDDMADSFAYGMKSMPESNKKKIFYNYYELSGWRFYLKAIRNKDWSSLKEHITDIYFR